jgi:hypothetical protein
MSIILIFVVELCDASKFLFARVCLQFAKILSDEKSSCSVRNPLTTFHATSNVTSFSMIKERISNLSSFRVNQSTPRSSRRLTSVLRSEQEVGLRGELHCNRVVDSANGKARPLSLSLVVTQRNWRVAGQFAK